MNSKIPNCDVLHHNKQIISNVTKSLPDINDLYDLADLYKVFADSTRIRILYTLLDNDLCVCDITNILGATQSAISHQLRILKSSKLVSYRKVGKQVIYSLADDHVRNILSCGMEHIKE